MIGYRYHALVDRVIDGDTVDLIVDLGFHVRVYQRFRLVGVNTPELRGAESQQGIAAKAFVQSILPIGFRVIVESSKTEKYGRWLGDILLQSSGTIQSVSQLIRDAGHSHIADG